MVPCERSCHKEYTYAFHNTYAFHMQYESPITSGLKVKAKVKVFQK